MSVNKAFILGRLGDDPEVRYTQSNTAVANLSVATTERYTDSNGNKKEQTEWHRVVLWDRLAEIAQQYVSKGDQVFIEGSIQTRKWEDRDGNDRYSTEIKGYRLEMLSGTSGGGNGQTNTRTKEVDGDTDLNDKFDDIDDDLPF